MFFKNNNLNNTEITTSNEKNYPSQVLSVHPSLRDLLWIANGEFKNWDGNPNVSHFSVDGFELKIEYGSDEPSLIDLDLTISTEKLEGVENPNYYPSYSKLTSKQRGVYWNFLRNPYSGEFDISYVFILYYGLERHLLQGDYEKAVEVIFSLRDVYDNNSFQTYSGNAIVLTSLLRKRPDYIERLYDRIEKNNRTSISLDMLLLCKVCLHEKLNSAELMKSARDFGFTNTNYIKKYPDIFKKYLDELLDVNEILVEKFVGIGELGRLKTKKVMMYANYSMPDSCIEIPSISSDEKLSAEVVKVLNEAHNAVKKYLSVQRKSGNEVAPKVQRKKDLKKAFDEEREEELLNQLKNAKGFVQRHFALKDLHEFYYYYRYISNKYIDYSRRYALDDIDILPKVVEEYRKQMEERFANFSHASEAEMSFRGEIPAFKRLCTIYEKERLYKSALEICDKALKHYDTVGNKPEIEKFEKKKETILKKI